MRRKHHDLDAWQVAIDLVKDVYALTTSFPAHEIYALTSQIRRCAVSVPSNIAEGCARLTAKEFIHFLGIARGSLSELETQLTIARELGYLDCITIAIRQTGSAVCPNQGPDQPPAEASK